MYKEKKDQFPTRLSEENFPRRLSILFLASLHYISFSETVIDKRDENTFESSPPLELRTIFQSTLGGNGNAVNFSNTVTITPTKRLSHTQAFCLELPLVTLVNKISSISPGSCLSPLEAHSPQSPVVEYSTNSKATNSLQKNRFC